MKPVVLTAVLFALAGCGTVAKNSDVGLMTIGKAPIEKSAAASGVATSETPPPEGAKTIDVSGYSCKSKIWDPSPSKENAIAMMKKDAMDRGASAVYGVVVKRDPASVVVNCWSGIRATGKAVINP